MEKLIITVAIIGNTTDRSQNPHVPITPKEIAESAIESAKAGAAVCHIHVRDPETGQVSMDFELYREVVKRIRDNSDILINLTTGTGARLVYENGWDTSGLKTPEERVDHVIRLAPELCSLDVGSMNFGPRVFVNLVSHVEAMARMIAQAGVKMELEVFDLGHFRIANHLIRQGLIAGRPLFQLCMGTPWGIEATAPNLVHMHACLPDNAIWCGLGIGAAQFPIVTTSILMGGHARTGFEDNVYISKGVLATSNSQLVEKTVQMAELMGREVATPSEAAQILGLGR